MAKLIVLHEGQAIPYELTDNDMIIGRNPDCQIRVPSEGVSRRHALMTYQDGAYFLEDLGTRNGTFVNAKQITSRTQLKHDDRIRLGPLRLRFEAERRTRTPPPDTVELCTNSGDDFNVDIVNDERDLSQKMATVRMVTGFGRLDVRPEAKLKAMVEISHSLAGAVNLEDLLPNLLDTLLTVLFPQAERGSILLQDDETGRMVPTAQQHRRSRDGSKKKLTPSDKSVRLSETVLNKVLTQKTGILSLDAAHDARFESSRSVQDLSMRSMMCAPMLNLEGEAIGIIHIDTRNPVETFNNDDMDLLMAIARQAALSYDSARQMLMRQRLESDMEIARHRALSEMVAGMAHEINTPLGIVNSTASLVGHLVHNDSLTELATHEVTRETLNDIAEATELMQANIARANQLIQDFKKLSVRQLTDLKEEVILTDQVDEIIRLFKVQARKAALELEVKHSLGAQDARWHGYPGHLSQVLLNLLMNVERYAYPNGAGGKVEIEVSAEQRDSGSMFILCVRDFGCGIPEEDQPQIFTPFFTRGRDRGGSGLGLAIVYNLVTDSLQGSISVESAPGAGATFRITFPQDIPETSS